VLGERGRKKKKKKKKKKLTSRPSKLSKKKIKQPRQEVIRTNLSVREGIEIIVSMGMALPKELVALT